MAARWNLISKLPSLQIKITVPDKFKGTIVEKWIKYWEGLIHDYSEVFKETVREARNKPRKAVTYFGIASALVYAAKKNPTEMDYRDRVLDYQNLFGLVGKPVRNPGAEVYLKALENHYNFGLVRRFSFGFFSIIWLDNYDEKLGLYKAQCNYLKPRYVTFYERIVDVGFLDLFWILERKMKDYDVNPNEWIDFTRNEYEYRHRIQ